MHCCRAVGAVVPASHLVESCCLQLVLAAAAYGTTLALVLLWDCNMWMFLEFSFAGKYNSWTGELVQLDRRLGSATDDLSCRYMHEGSAEEHKLKALRLGVQAEACVYTLQPAGIIRTNLRLQAAESLAT